MAQSSGIFICDLFNAPPLVSFYLGRIFNLILYIILGYFSIKIIPIFKLAVFLILLMPMNISLGASMSSDATLITASLIYIGIILKFIVTDKKLSTVDLIQLSFLTVILALIKHHFFLLPLILLIPKKSFGDKYILKLSLLVFPAIFACLAWSKNISDLYIPLHEGADMFQQIDFIIHNPISFFVIIVKTIFVKTLRIIITMIGVLDWQDTRLDILTYIFYPIALIYVALNYYDKKVKLSKIQTIILSLSLLISYFIIVTYMYLSWSPVGSGIVTGLNGKYFITLLLPLLILLASKIKTSFILNNNLIFTFSFFVLFSAVISLLIRFYNVFPNLYYQI